MKKKNRFFSLIIIFHSERKPFQINIPISLLYFLGSTILITGLFGITTIIYQHFDLNQKQEEIRLLKYDRKENIELKNQLSEFYSYLYQMEDGLKNLAAKEKELRDIYGFKIKEEEKKKLLASRKANNQTISISSLSDNLNEQDSSEGIERLETILNEIPQQNSSLDELLQKIETKKIELLYIPSIYPTYGEISSGYGTRRDPFTKKLRFHAGIDFANVFGTPIFAAANGIVESVTYDSGYGWIIIINHTNGIKTVYGHLSKLLVKVGERVEKGEKIATMGSSGRSTGPHLHYEVRVNNTTVNPMKFLP